MKPLRFAVLAMLLSASVAAVSLTVAQGQGQGQGRDKGKGPKDQPVVAVRVVFQDSDREVFRQYYRDHRDQLKPLPPGSAKNLARGKPLPPGIARTRVPDVVVTRLAWRPAGYSFLLIGDRIVLVNPAGLVADILDRLF